MSRPQLQAERNRLQLLYTNEMSALTWPMLQWDECQWADPSAGESPPPSRDGALVAIGGANGGRAPYVVVTEDRAPQLHEWMRETVWLREEIERRGPESSDG